MKDNMTEQEFLNSYDIKEYERPSIATDIAVMSIMDEGERESNKRLQKKQLKILMIQRGTHPFKHRWALPGGFLIPGVDVMENAARELYEETNVKDVYMKLVGVYGAMGRDPRGWIISNTYMALVNGATCKPRSGSDAWKAVWFGIELTSEVESHNKAEKEESVVVRHNLVMKNTEEDVCITAEVLEYRTMKCGHRQSKFKMVTSENLAFDHGQIIVETVLMLREQVAHDWNVVFDLLPEEFTLTQVQNAIELVLDQTLVGPNFRRKIVDYVKETEHVMDGEGYRPAKLFVRNGIK